MKKVMIFSTLLIAGMVGSQFLPDLLGASYPSLIHIIRLLTMAALAFIMIHVGMSSTSTNAKSAATAGTTWWR